MDHNRMRITAMDAADSRAILVKVAGVAALFIAKVYKIVDRVESGRHQRTAFDKDAADVFRLIQSTPVAAMTTGFALALSKDVSQAVAESALNKADQLFGRERAVGVEMAIRAISVAAEAPETIAAVFVGYTSSLMAGVRALSAGPR